MRIRIPCPQCQKVLKVPVEHAGKKGKCPQCATVFRIPELPEAAQPATAPPPLDPFADPAPAPSSAPPTDDDFLGDVNLSEFADAGPPKTRKRSQPSPSASSTEDTYSLSAPADDDFGGTYDEGGNLPELNPLRPKRKKNKKRSEPEPPPTPVRSGWKDALIFLFGVALVPLAISIFTEDPPIEDRLQKTFGNDTVAVLEQVSSASDPDAAFEQALDKVQGHKLAGAHLGYDTSMHWLYALIAGGVFLGLLIYLGNREVSAGELLFYGIATGTVGIVLLLGFQWVAFATQGFWVRGRSILVVLFYLVKFIGYSYNCALNPENGFFMSFLGFTCGVGLCEEVCKAVPIMIYLQSERPTWRGALMVGLASGIGFGVSEGINYSSNHYNGYADGMTYLVRFASCVSLHAIWAGIVGMLMFNHESHAQAGEETDLIMFVINYLLGVMILHGLYDTLLKKDMAVWALLIAALSIGWLGVLFYRGRTMFESELATA